MLNKRKILIFIESNIVVKIFISLKTKMYKEKININNDNLPQYKPSLVGSMLI